MYDQPSGSGTDLTSSAMSGKDVSVPREMQSETEDGTVAKKPKKPRKKRTELQ